MAEGELHGTIPQLLALGRRQLVHTRAVLFHDQSARGLRLDELFRNFHCFSIAPPRPNVKEK
jgi:hypothetical protein